MEPTAGVALGVSVLLQVAVAAALTSYSFFFVDDFLFMGQARSQPFDLTYLRETLFEHFSPIAACSTGCS